MVSGGETLDITSIRCYLLCVDKGVKAETSNKYQKKLRFVSYTPQILYFCTNDI